MAFIPCGDRIAVEPIQQEERTAGGIIIPDTAKEKPMVGRVVAVGNGTRKEDGSLIPVNVNVGDRVVYGKWAGTELKLDGEQTLVIIKESDVMGLLA